MGRQQLSFGPLPSLSHYLGSVCVCVCWGTSQSRPAAIVIYEMQGQWSGWEQAEAVEMFSLCWLCFVTVALTVCSPDQHS